MISMTVEKKTEQKMEPSIRIIKQKPLETREDYQNMIIFINEIEEKAKKSNELRMDLLQGTGMYTKKGEIKKELINV